MFPRVLRLSALLAIVAGVSVVHAQTTAPSVAALIKQASRPGSSAARLPLVTRDPASVTDADYALLRAEFGDRGALEVVLQTCNFAFMNRFTDNLGLPSEDEAVKVYHDVYGTDWKKP